MTTAMLQSAKNFVSVTIPKAASHAANRISKAIHREKFRMLLIGETGSGKTSFLNLLCNSKLIEELGLSCNPATMERIQSYNEIEVENATEHAMASKTSEAIMYHTQVCGLKMTVIDTPGFGDSRGLDQDKKNVAKVIDMLRLERHINCVCIVINGRQSRMSASLKYVLSEISTILPKEIFNNIIIIFTNTADPLDCNFDIKELDAYIGARKDEHFYYIENPYCKIEKSKQSRHLSNERIAKSLGKSFQETADCLLAMKEKIKKFEDVHTYHFIKLYEKKEKIEKNIIDQLAAYDEQDSLAKQIKAKEEELEVALRTKKLNNDFKTTKIIKVHQPIATPDKRHNTLCGAPGCYSNCHMPCYLEKTFDQESFKSCASMGGTNTCKVCSHSYKVHYHNEVYFTEVEKKEEIVDEKMMQKFKEAQSMEEKAQILRDGLSRRHQTLVAQKTQLSKQLSSAISEFKHLGISKLNYAKLLEKQRDIIEMRLENTIGDEGIQLRETKEDIDKKLQVIYDSTTPKHSFTKV